MGAAHDVWGRWPGPLGAEATLAETLDVMYARTSAIFQIFLMYIVHAPLLERRRMLCQKCGEEFYLYKSGKREWVGAAHHVRSCWRGSLGAEATSAEAPDVMCGR